MFLRILSDLHLQINESYPLVLDNDEDCYTLIAGDLGPDFKKNSEWVKNNVKKGAFISGNHDAYTSKTEPIEDVKEFYHKMFPLNSDVTYFDNDVGVIQKDLGNNILLVADVLYTNFRLRYKYDEKGISIKEVVRRNIHRVSPKFSGSYMNDFLFFTRDLKRGHLGQNFDSDVAYISPEYYIHHFNKAFRKITEIIESNPDNDIVLMTHHCLSEKCFDEYKHKDLLSSAYASPKESWIKKHPNIKLVISGHIHNRREFKVGNTLYMMNPLGYCREGQFFDIDKNTNERVYWSPDVFVDTENWSVVRKPYINEKWVETYDDYRSFMVKS